MAVGTIIVEDMNNGMRRITTMTLETTTKYLSTIIIFFPLPTKDYSYSPASRKNDLTFPRT